VYFFFNIIISVTFIGSNIIVQAVMLDDFNFEPELPSGRYPESFCEFVVEWEWPKELRRSQTEQIKNVAGVLWRIYHHGPPYRDKATYREARSWRASIARTENPDLFEEYEKTVHANCVRDRGFRGNRAMHDFLEEAENLIRAYDNGD
jgi:hypothetical protein